MISKELKAQASLAWHNWKTQHPGQSPPMSEEDFISKFEELQQLHNKGLIPSGEFDAKVTQLLKDPPVATTVSQFQPAQASTEALLKELEQLKAAGVLNEEEFHERKSELFFQRGVQPADENEEGQPESSADNRDRYMGYLDELLNAGILTQVEYESAKARLGS